ncbi:NAD(P)H-dependent FMN reductase [Imperialibacter sp. EC-SDR9]|nr:Flavoprotein [Imperialibacter sp. 75]CAD5286724.1 Flavoprotein [Imperialibacter sp. 89]VVT05744.1 NAD(P)H-dependent FMN reductase [Imperialibacter sp. EC-SDR9]
MIFSRQINLSATFIFAFMKSKTVKVLAISGSINPGATAGRLLQAIERLAGPGFQFAIFESLGGIPHFNPQQSDTITDKHVLHWRNLWKQADAVIICTPEYAFGMPGVLKDALDWLVGSGEVYHKPLAALSYSPSMMGGENALSTLLLTLKAQNADFDDSTTSTIPAIRQRFSLEGEITDPTLSTLLTKVLESLANKCEKKTDSH